MLSIPHLLIIFLVALIVLGPDKLPQVARALGKTMAEFRRITADFRTTIEGEVREMERQAEIRQAAEAAKAEVNDAIEAVGGVAHDVSQTGVEARSQSDALSDSTRMVPETTLPPEPQEPVAASTPASPEKLTNG
jgi:Tat protein translocase TatB subunit